MSTCECPIACGNHASIVVNGVSLCSECDDSRHSGIADSSDEGDPMLTCDVCGKQEWSGDLTPDWNGETGNHLSCEQRVDSVLTDHGRDVLVEYTVPVVAVIRGDKVVRVVVEDEAYMTPRRVSERDSGVTITGARRKEAIDTAIEAAATDGWPAWEFGW